MLGIAPSRPLEKALDEQGLCRRARWKTRQLALIASMYSYSREQEREAERISVRLMSTAGYDPSPASEVWGNLLAELKARPNADDRMGMTAGLRS